MDSWQADEIKTCQNGRELLVLCCGKNKKNIAIYVYLLLSQEEITGFMNAVKKSGFNPDDFGRIIESGVGVPSRFLHEEIMAKIEDGAI